MFRSCLVMLVGLAAAGPAWAASWADAMFDTLTRDFGSVPRGSILSHPFRLTNNTGTHVTISSVRAGCNCTSARALLTELEPGQSTVILAEMDTHKFQRDKNVIIYVQFSRPRFEEVRLWVQANSRDDVTVTPDTLAFGQVKKGTSPTAGVHIAFAGSSDWQIASISCESNYVQAALQRLPASSTYEISYQLTARLRPDTPVGKWYTDIWLQTNNPATPRIRVPVTVEVQAALSLTPAAVTLGQIKVGTANERKVILRGHQPFKVTAVKGADRQWTVRDSTDASKAIHVLTVSLKPQKPGELKRTITIITDLKQEGRLEFQVQATVVK